VVDSLVEKPYNIFNLKMNYLSKSFI